MPRVSRKDRKTQRERVLRAVERGLPAPTPDLRKNVRSSALEDARSSDAPAPKGQSAIELNKGHGGWFSNWQTMLKLLVVATLVLLGIGLWRTLTSKTGQ